MRGPLHFTDSLKFSQGRGLTDGQEGNSQSSHLLPVAQLLTQWLR